MYYLQSRYYNPEWGRFINEDEIATITGDVLSTNMYAYCKNNPINMSDADGDRPIFSDSLADETDEMRAVSLAIMNHKYDYDNGTIENSNILFYKEHTNNARPSTQEKHQKGQTRKQTDNRGEKGDSRRKPNPNKRRTQNIEITPPTLGVPQKVILIGGVH